MSEDPKLFDAGDYNLFRYCHNDPIDLTDPMGLLPNMPYHWTPELLAQLTKGLGASEAYARIMGLVQNAMSGLNSTAGAISIGAAGHQLGAIANALAGWTPMRNPNAKAYAEARWGGENAPDHSETRAQIQTHFPGGKNAGAYTVPTYGDVEVTAASGKPLFSITVGATRHMPYDVSARD